MDTLCPVCVEVHGPPDDEPHPDVPGTPVLFGEAVKAEVTTVDWAARLREEWMEVP